MRKHNKNQLEFCATCVSARLGTARVKAPSILVSQILRPSCFNETSKKRSSQKADLTTANVASVSKSSQFAENTAKNKLGLQSPVHSAAMYVFTSLWDDNNDYLIQVLGESMMSIEHINALAEANGTSEVNQNNNIIRSIVDSMCRSGDELLDAAGLCSGSSSHVSTNLTSRMDANKVVTERMLLIVAEFWTACRLMEILLLCGETAKELALRIPIGKRNKGGGRVSEKHFTISIGYNAYESSLYATIVLLPIHVKNRGNVVSAGLLATVAITVCICLNSFVVNDHDLDIKKYWH